MDATSGGNVVVAKYPLLPWNIWRDGSGLGLGARSLFELQVVALVTRLSRGRYVASRPHVSSSVVTSVNLGELAWKCGSARRSAKVKVPANQETSAAAEARRISVALVLSNHAWTHTSTASGSSVRTRILLQNCDLPGVSRLLVGYGLVLV